MDWLISMPDHVESGTFQRRLRWLKAAAVPAVAKALAAAAEREAVVEVEEEKVVGKVRVETGQAPLENPQAVDAILARSEWNGEGRVSCPPFAPINSVRTT